MGILDLVKFQLWYQVYQEIFYDIKTFLIQYQESDTVSTEYQYIYWPSCYLDSSSNNKKWHPNVRDRKSDRTPFYDKEALELVLKNIRSGEEGGVESAYNESEAIRKATLGKTGEYST